MTALMEEQGRTAPTARSPVVTWVRVCRLGAVAAVVWSIALQLEIGALMPDMAVIGVVFAVLAFFLTGARRRLAIVTGALALLALVGNLTGTIDVLSHPTSGVAFAMTVLSTLAATVCVVAGVALLARWRAELARPVVAFAAALLAAGVGVAVVASASVTSAEPRPDDIAVVAERNQFDPPTLTVDAGPTGFWLDNRDGIRHTLTIAETGDEIDAPGYSAQRGDVDLAPGTYTIICDVPGHEHMRIDLTVDA